MNEETGMTETYDYTYYMNGEEVAVDPFSQAEVDALSAFISSVNQRSYFNEDIINIVKGVVFVACVFLSYDRSSNTIPV